MPDAKTIRIVSWNIRAGGGRRANGILEQLLEWRADIIGLAEFRGTSASQWLAAQLAETGYSFQLSSANPASPASNALLLASRYPLHALTLPAMPTNAERWLLARVEAEPAITLALMHIPNYTTPTLKYPYLASVLKMLDAWDTGPGLLIGDANCGKHIIDEEIPSSAKFRREHDWIIGVEQRGWVDAFRHLQGDQREYTWYSHRNNGFRLDYAFTSPQLTPAIVGMRHAWGVDSDNRHRREALSDHAAIILDLGRSKIRKDL